MTALPDPLRSAVEEALERRTGRATVVTGATPVSGGSINAAARVATDAGDDFFLKWNASPPPGLFAAEADGLRALADAAGDDLRVPAVVALRDADGSTSWLLMELVESGGHPGWGRRLGRGLAALHEPGGEVGWRRDNYIGSLPQANPGTGERVGSGRGAGGGPAPPAGDPTPIAWSDFWAQARILPQLRSARDRGHFGGRPGRLLDDLLERIPDILADAPSDGPSLLHGDLWGGNAFCDDAGRPVLVDPAVYRGHREVDLAMSELFGFPADFLPAYREARPVEPGYDAFRRDLYQLYYLLVHVNLFGSGYEAGCLRAARRVLGAVGS